jgi:hypothetical protein
LIIRILVLLILSNISAVATASPVYFVVSDINNNHNDSYVIGLENEYEIAHARNLIEFGPSAGGSILIADIAAGSDGINRNVQAAGEPLWNWHVTQFLGFADFTAEIYDAWPSYVESDVGGWIANTGGRIGFWNYTVTQEITAVPVPAAVWLFGSALAGLGWIKRKKAI